jgi:hypothetical protein
MAKQSARQVWVDRYVRDELAVDETVKFEQALMDSPAMQQNLETALGLREALLLEPEQNVPRNGLLPEPLPGGGNWQPVALAASVLLAVFSSVMFWKVSNDSAGLQNQLDLLKQPRTQVLTVPVNIMRSASNRTPDVIIQKPVGHSAILLDIELGPAASNFEELVFELVDDDGTAISSWNAAPVQSGRASVLLNSEQVPSTRLWLQISSNTGQKLGQRLLEFR